MSEVTKLFEQRIEEWLTQARKEDAAFDKKVADSKKDVKGCCNHILSVVKLAKQCGYDDAEIYGMARHYFDEDEIKDPGEQKVSRIVVTGHVELSEAEKLEAIEDVKRQYLRELKEKEDAKEKERKQKLQERRKQAEDSQLDLFEGM